MTLAVRALLLVAGLLALHLARGDRRHRPIAALLLSTVALDTTADVCRMPRWLDLGAHLAIPGLSAWCAMRVLGQVRNSAALFAAAPVVVAPLAAAVAGLGTWETWPAAALVGSFLVQALAVYAWWGSRRSGHLATRCALVLVVGEALALMSPRLISGDPWWIVDAQTILMGLALVAMQVHEMAGERNRRASLRAWDRSGRPYPMAPRRLDS